MRSSSHLHLLIKFSFGSFEGTVRTILTEQGFRGLYRGLGPTILGYLPTWAIYFAVYDGIKNIFGEPPPGTRERLYPAAQVKGYQPVMREHPWSLHILSAMTAGAASTICTNPLWVIKTRFMVRTAPYLSGLASDPPSQTQLPGDIRYRHTLDAAITIYRTEGLRAFYRGLVPSLLGIMHVAVQFPLYEHLKLYARNYLAFRSPLPSLTLPSPFLQRPIQKHPSPAKPSSCAPPYPK